MCSFIVRNSVSDGGKSQALHTSRCILGLCVLVFAGWAEQAMAVACTSVASGNWNVRSTWGTAAAGCAGAPGGIPGAGDTATIANTRTVTVNVNTTVGAVTVNAGGTLNVRGVNFTVNGATGISGTLAHVTSTAGTKTYIGLVTINAGGVWNNAINEAVTFRGGITHNGTTFTGGAGTQTFANNDQVIGGTSSINFGGAVAVAANRTVTNNNTSVVTIAGNLTGGNANSIWVNGANATLNYGGAAAPMNTSRLTASAAGNTVNYMRAGTQTVKLQNATYFNLSLSGNNTKTIGTGGSQTLTVAGNLTIGAGVTYNGTTRNPAVNLAGNFSNSGTFNSGTGRFTFNGTSAVTPQLLTGAATFTNMGVNNTGIGLQLASNITVTTASAGTLILTDGVIDTQAFTLIITRNCNVAGLVQRLAATSGWIAGNLQKRIPTGTPVSCTFEIGDATTYRPINMTFARVTTAGNVTGWSSQSAGDHPDTTANASGVDSAKSVNRYWTLTNSGVIFTTSGATCSATPSCATFNYVAGDLDDVGSLPTVVVRGSSCAGSGGSRTCSTWASLTPSSASSTQTTVTGLTAFGDFAIGQAKTPNFSREPQFIYTREIY